MKWVPAIWTALVLTLVTGCTQGPTAGLDPFGRTTIPSPATRAAQVPVVVPSQVDPYYSGNVSTAPLVPVGPRASSNSATPSLAPTLAPTLAATGGPPNAWRPPENSNTATSTTSGRLQPVSPEFLAGNPAWTSTQVTSTANNSGPVRPATYVEEAGQLNWRDPAVGPRTTNPPAARTIQPRVEIGNLPPATAQGSNSILRTSQTSPANGVTNVANVAVSRYGFSHDYRWLKGQLEYSGTQRQWKLRYIPSGGQPDRFGGSVTLDSVAELGQFRHGDFIQVQGVVSATNPNAPSATGYRISRIARLP